MIRTHLSSRPLGKTTCTPPTWLPSLKTANDTFFCLLTDLIHPFRLVVEAVASVPAEAAAREEATVGGRAGEAVAACAAREQL